MPLVFAGICSHGPGITGRADRAEPELRDPFYAALGDLRDGIKASGAEALVVIAAEHFANFFMDNMPAYAIGMGEEYEGPIEDPDWLKIPRTTIPGAPDLSKRIIGEVMQSVDVAYAEEWKMDHGIMVPLHFLTPEMELPVIPANINCQGPPLTPLHRAYAFGQALRRAIDAQPERVAVMGTGGISHWPATPNSGKDQRSLGQGVSRPLGRERPRRATRLYRRGHAARGRTGRVRNPHAHLHRGAV